MAEAAAFFDLDRTLLLGASGPVISDALRERGLLGPDRLGVGRAAFGLFDLIGETLPSIALTRVGVRAVKGWPRGEVQAAGRDIVPTLSKKVEPFAKAAIEDHRARGHKVVLATTTPFDLVEPFAEAMGFDDVLATRYRVADDGTYKGEIDGEFVWNRGKARSVATWARANLVELSDSWAYSDSVFDLPMLSAVGNPVAVNPDARLLVVARTRGWPITWFNAPPGVPKPIGIEPQDVLAQLAQPRLFPWARFDLQGADTISDAGGAILASNHRSYLDPLAIGMLAASAERPTRFLTKAELTDAPVVGSIISALGAIRVDRGSGSDEPLRQAAQAVSAGELIAVFPQGTIPRGPAFFDPKLEARTGAARLALQTGAPLIPVGIWGSDRAWPRNSKVPYILNLARPPQVQVRVGEPYRPTGDDVRAITEDLMARIVDLLPPEAKQHRTPTDAELAATYPDGVIPDEAISDHVDSDSVDEADNEGADDHS
ncbi:MAG: HAD-IB family hydrolase [Actinomycetota bacterium]